MNDLGFTALLFVAVVVLLVHVGRSIHRSRTIIRAHTREPYDPAKDPLLAFHFEANKGVILDRLGVDVKLRQPFNGGHRASHGKGSIIIGADRCPHCGCGDACYSEEHPSRPTAIFCEDCGAHTPECSNRIVAVEVWNDGQVVPLEPDRATPVELMH